MATPSTTTTWPPPNNYTTPLVPRSNAVLSFGTTIPISAPASLVFAVIRDHAAYSTWNTFTPIMQIDHDDPNNAPSTIDLNTPFTLHVIIDPAKPNQIFKSAQYVTDVSTPEVTSSRIPQVTLDEDGCYERDLRRVYRISWAGQNKGILAKGMTTERVSEFIVLEPAAGGEERCLYRTWECQSGIVARLTKLVVGAEAIEKRIRTSTEELKREAERQWREQKARKGGT